MRHLLARLGSERGSGLVEYAILVAFLGLALIPAIALTNDAVAARNQRAASHFATTNHTYSSGGGESGATTTTTLPPTTTTTLPPTTTTTLPPTTTTTVPASQIETASFNGEIFVTFTEVDGEVTFGSVEADGWTYKVTKDTGTRIHLAFTQEDPDRKVIVKGFLNKSEVLKTKVIEKY